MRLAYSRSNLADPTYGGIFMGSELQTMNGQNKLALWAEHVSVCRSSDQSVRDWCKTNGICEQTFYRRIQVTGKRSPFPVLDLESISRLSGAGV